MKKPSKSLIPPEAVATEADVARILKLTPARKKEIAAEQKRLAKLSASRARLNRNEIARARGVDLERHYRITGDADNIARAMAMQGRFADAAKIAQSAHLVAEYKQIDKAVKSKDHPCGCDKVDEHGLPTESVVREVYSEKHKRVMPIVRCGICGELNVRKLPQKLAEMKEKRAAAVAARRDLVKTFE